MGSVSLSRIAIKASRAASISNVFNLSSIPLYALMTKVVNLSIGLEKDPLWLLKKLRVMSMRT